jgi:hypothetical protein
VISQPADEKGEYFISDIYVVAKGIVQEAEVFERSI